MLLNFRAKDINILITGAQPKQFIFAVCLHFKKSLCFSHNKDAVLL